jgi:ABC-2 type transport system permease protein
MNGVVQALWVEWLKASRSRLPLFSALGFALAPLSGGFVMIVLRDPELARRAGLISTKAQIVAGAADWPTYLALLAQATAIGGFILFSLIGSWVFGREFVDRTVKDLLALPVSRSAIVAAKLVLLAAWALALSVMIFLIGLGVGSAVGLPPTSVQVMAQAAITLADTAALTFAVVTPVVFFASAGRGYLPPMGVAFLLLIAAQLIAWAGWGEYFPWSIPALYAGVVGTSGALGIASYAVVLLTGTAGVAATFLWWVLADQTR